MRWAGHVACMGTMRSFYKILVRKPERIKPLGRCRHRWKDIRMDIMEIGQKGVDWLKTGSL